MLEQHAKSNIKYRNVTFLSFCSIININDRKGETYYQFVDFILSLKNS